MNKSISRNKCRTCLRPGTNLNPLNTISRMLNVNKSYLELLKYVTNMEVFTHDKDHEQQGVCDTCSLQIHASYTFIQQVQECNKYFMADYECVASNSFLPKRSLGNEIKINTEKEQVIKQDTDDIFQEYLLNQLKFELFPGDSSSLLHHSLNDFSGTASILGGQIMEGTTDKFFSRHPFSIITDPPNGSNEDNTNTSAEELYTISSSSESNNTFANKPTAINEVIPRDDVLLPVKCDECDIVFDNSLLLKRHKRIIHNKDELQVKCPQCPSIFNRRHNMYVHVREFHNQENDFGASDILMQQHSHTREPLFKCGICDKIFSLPCKLKMHMFTHTNDRPYKCTECEKAFKRPKDLNMHKRTHTGERPHKCIDCEKSFTQSNSLKRHQRKYQHFKSPTEAAVT